MAPDRARLAVYYLLVIGLPATCLVLMAVLRKLTVTSALDDSRMPGFWKATGIALLAAVICVLVLDFGVRTVEKKTFGKTLLMAGIPRTKATANVTVSIPKQV